MGKEHGSKDDIRLEEQRSVHGIHSYDVAVFQDIIKKKKKARS